MYIGYYTNAEKTEFVARYVFAEGKYRNTDKLEHDLINGSCWDYESVKSMVTGIDKYLRPDLVRQGMSYLEILTLHLNNRVSRVYEKPVIISETDFLTAEEKEVTKWAEEKVDVYVQGTSCYSLVRGSILSCSPGKVNWDIPFREYYYGYNVFTLYIFNNSSEWDKVEVSTEHGGEWFSTVVNRKTLPINVSWEY